MSGLARLVQGDDPVGPAVTAVDDRRRLGLLGHEKIEVVTHKFHVVDGVIEGELGRGEHLPADQYRRVAGRNIVLDLIRRLLCRRRLGPLLLRRLHIEGFAGAGRLQGCRRLGDGLRGMPAVVDLSAVAGPAQAFKKLVVSEIERTVLVGGTRFCADYWAASQKYHRNRWWCRRGSGWVRRSARGGCRR